MNRVLITSIALLSLLSGSAVAADMGMPLKAPAPPPPAVSWTGCYINGGVGYGMWDATHNLETYPGLVPISTSSDSAGQGWLGRVGGGCDYQFNSNFVIGAFGDFDIMNLNGNVASNFIPIQGTATEQSAWAVGVRAGYLVTPTLLTYFDGGYTGSSVGQINLSIDDRFHETAQLHLWSSTYEMGPFRASNMIRTLEALD